MRILFELIGAFAFLYVLALGLSAWIKAQNRLAADRRELEEFRRQAEKSPPPSIKE
jgi:hypothetical protein